MLNSVSRLAPVSQKGVREEAGAIGRRANTRRLGGKTGEHRVPARLGHRPDPRWTDAEPNPPKEFEERSEHAVSE